VIKIDRFSILAENPRFIELSLYLLEGHFLLLMMTPQIVYEADLSEERIHQMLQLKGLVWPEKYHEGSFVMHWEEFSGKRGFCSGRAFVLIYDGDQLVAQAEQFPRTIKSEKTSVKILALAGVAVHPDYRGRGLGRLVLQPIFDRVDAGEFLFSLFQTPIPEFYARLGSVAVKDSFYDGQTTSKREQSIWWEDHVMIYPANRPWLDGPIDLNGPAY
jgi:GNAT superfamily N-acetyltransferase